MLLKKKRLKISNAKIYDKEYHPVVLKVVRATVLKNGVVLYFNYEPTLFYSYLPSAYRFRKLRRVQVERSLDQLADPSIRSTWSLMFTGYTDPLEVVKLISEEGEFNNKFIVQFDPSTDFPVTVSNKAIYCRFYVWRKLIKAKNLQNIVSQGYLTQFSSSRKSKDEPLSEIVVLIKNKDYVWDEFHGVIDHALTL